MLNGRWHINYHLSNMVNGDYWEQARQGHHQSPAREKRVATSGQPERGEPSEAAQVVR